MPDPRRGREGAPLPYRILGVTQPPILPTVPVRQALENRRMSWTNTAGRSHSFHGAFLMDNSPSPDKNS
jgi:hypothetical protein